MDYRDYLVLIGSARVTPRTSEVLLKRRAPAQIGHAPQFFSREEFSELEAVLARLIPQSGNTVFVNLAAGLDHRQATGPGQGWRYASLPPDPIAATLGLRLLQETAQQFHGADFAALDEVDQDDLLRRVQSGLLSWTELDGRKWFENLLAEATEIYVSHPATLAAIGFGGIAFLPRWPAVGLNTTQSWEPVRE